MDLTKHPILQRCPSQMVEHRERCRRRKYGLGKGQRRRIALNHAGTGVPQAVGQKESKTEIDLNSRKAPTRVCNRSVVSHIQVFVTAK
jgi:hypothetical protein